MPRSSVHGSEEVIESSDVPEGIDEEVNDGGGRVWRPPLYITHHSTYRDGTDDGQRYQWTPVKHTQATRGHC